MNLIRCTAQAPCPICQAPKWCSVSDDGDWACCMKVESERPTADQSGWMHRLSAPVHANGAANGRHGATVKAPAPKGGATVTRYRIVDPASGELVAVHCRRDFADGRDKEIWWEQPNGDKGLGGKKLADLPLYGADDLVAAPGSVVIVTEGEKAADALRSIGVAAVGTVTGAASGPSAMVFTCLSSYDVCLWPDNDATGASHQARNTRTLRSIGVTPRVFHWAGAPPKGDAADFVAAGLGRDELNALYVAASIGEADDSQAAPEPPFPVDLHLTDMGNAERLVARHGADLRYCGPWKRWVVWGGETWAENGDDRVQERAKETVLSIYEEGIAATNPERAQALWKHAQRSESAGKVHSLVDLARSAPSLAVTPDDLDRDPWLLNCANGTVDLQRGELLPYTREDLMTKRSPALFNTSARCPTWEAFLDQIFAGAADMVEFLQRCAGYCLSGSTAERVLFILFGAGRNGKSTFLEVLRHVLGDYASGTPASTIMSQRNKGIPNDIARLKGARFVSASETSEAAEIDEAFIKVSTGGDTITARFLNAEFFDFRPQFKIWLATNHKPAIKGTDPAVWDRIRLVPFAVRIPEAQLDKGLRDKLIAEADGILQWMIAGCLDWQRLGSLGEPPAVREATTDYRVGENILDEFFEDRCLEDRNVNASSAELYKAYQDWADQVGEEKLSQRRFGDRLRERGFRAGRDPTGNQRIWIGVSLLTRAPATKKTKRSRQEDGLEMDE